MARLRLGTTAALVAAGLAVACAPTLQHANRPDATFAGPRLEDRAFVSFDGARLGLTRWEAQGPAPPWAVIIGVHGMNDYAAAFHLAGPWWAARGVTTLAYDQRGFGRSPQRGVWAPDALRTEDLRTIVALARARYPGAIVAVVGESLGGATAIETFASDRPPDADRLVLSSPAVWGWKSQALPNRVALWLAARVAPGKVFNPPRWLTGRISATDNQDELKIMGRDPLMIWGARSDALYGLVDTMQAAQDETGGIRGPALYLYGAHDQIIPKGAAARALSHYPKQDRTAYYAKGWHLLLRDRQAETVWGDILTFIKNPDAPLPSGAPPITLSRP